MRIPADGQWKSAQTGDLFGHIIGSKNLDFNRDGYLALARKAMVLYSAEENAALHTVIALAADNTFLYIITESGVFQMNLTDPALTLTQLTLTNAPDTGFQSDACFYNGLLTVSGASTVKTYAAGAWTTRISGIDNTAPHPLCVSEHQNYLAVGNGKFMPLYDNSYSNITTLVVDPQYIFTCIRWRQNSLFGGTRNIQGGEAKVFIWNGSGAAAQQGYGVGADWVYSMCPYTSTVAIMTSLGQLMQYNGGGFSELANLPVYYTPYSWSSDAAIFNLLGRVASRGMQASGSRILINLDGALRQSAQEYPGKYLPTQPSGLWAYEPAVGLYHKAGYNFKTELSLSPTEIDSGFLVFATPHQALTGDAVLCSGNSALVGTVGGQIYYAIVGGPNALKLAISPNEAFAGNAITVSGTPAAGDTFDFDRYEGMGSGLINNPGALLVIASRHPNLFYGAEVFFGGEAFKQDMSANAVLMSLGLGRNRGYCITAKIPSTQIKDTFQKIISYFDPFWLDTDEMIIKYRTLEMFGFPTPLSTGTLPSWTSTTTFTVNPQKKDVQQLSVGDEIEIVEGSASGYLAHITAIDTSNPVLYTFTIDEALPVSNGDMFDFVGMNWKKWKIIANSTTLGGDVSKNNTKGFADMSLDKSSNWVQMKIELRGFGRYIRAMDVVNPVNRGIE